MAQKNDESGSVPVCSCSAEKAPRRVTREYHVDPITFIASVDAWGCPGCDAIEFDAHKLDEVEERIAAMLAREGVNSPEAFRFIRKAIGLRAADLANLLDVTPETVSRWERGRIPVDARALAVLGTLAIEHAEGRSEALARLRAIRGGERGRATRIAV